MRRALRYGRALLALLTLLTLLTAPAQAHKPSDSYLTLALHGQRIDGQWDIALRDLDFALDLDRDGDGQLTWDEIRVQHAAIAAYALQRLTLSSGGAACPLEALEQLIDRHTDGAYTVLRLRATCPAPVATLDIGYRLFAELDPQHKGLLNLSQNGMHASAILGPEAPRQSLSLAAPDRLGQFGAYVRHGIWHIWIGFDHILFLLSLLLPAVLVMPSRSEDPHATPTGTRSGPPSGPGPDPAADSASGPASAWARWAPRRIGVATLRLAFFDVLKVVTAFTLAHSITLTLAALSLIALPSRLVESAIAASVVLAALNNVFPLFRGRRPLAAFAFGLIHGFGFASVLGDLGLPQSALVRSLLGFNVGVELGQLAIVAVFLPLAFLLRRTWFYRQLMSSGSVLIAAIAAGWLIERAFDLKWMPF
ncbi:MAG: HupE/UreJ family protein [Pseudomonadota bacterium]